MALPVRNSGDPTASNAGDRGDGVFEFASHIRAEMSAADELFHRGQLLPFRPTSSSSSSHLPSAPTTTTRAIVVSPRLPPLPPPRRCHSEDSRRAPRLHAVKHVRAASLDEMERPRPTGGGGPLQCWKGFSQGYQKLPPASSVSWSSSSASVATQSSPRMTSASRPKWYGVVFGPLKVPSEMEMRDMRNRHRRRSQAAESGSGGSDGKAGHWKILRSLSCKGDVGAAALTPSGFMS